MKSRKRRGRIGRQGTPARAAPTIITAQLRCCCWLSRSTTQQTNNHSIPRSIHGTTLLTPSYHFVIYFASRCVLSVVNILQLIRRSVVGSLVERILRVYDVSIFDKIDRETQAFCLFVQLTNRSVVGRSIKGRTNFLTL